MDTPLLSSSSIGSSSSTSSHSVVDTNHDDQSKKYDVFLNYRSSSSLSSCDDHNTTMKNLVDHLRAALSEKGIKTFSEEEEEDELVMMEGGRLVRRAMGDSSCSVVMFSPSYAASPRCLDELVTIRDCVKTRGHIVVPAFILVDPNHVRKRLGCYGEAFAKHEKSILVDNLERVHRWKVALVEITSLGGLDLQNYRDETHFIKELVEEVSSKLESIAPSKTLEDDRSCHVGKILSFGNYGLTSVLGSVGAVLVFCLVVFPLFGAFVFIVAPYVAEGKMRVPTISFGKHYWPKLF